MNFITNLDPMLLGIIALSIFCIVLLILIISMNMKLKKFLIGIKAESIADSISQVSMDLKELQEFKTELEEYLANVEKRLRKGVRSVETVRFNPFKGTGDGGNQSFATAFINEEGDGVIISSLYSRDRVSVFGKPVRKNTSAHELSDEEREALETAKKGVK